MEITEFFFRFAMRRWAPGTGDRRGDAYFAGYTGLNYYFYGQELTIMSGVKYARMTGGPGGGGFDGWT